MRTSNPAMQNFVHPEVYRGAMAVPEARAMTYRGTIVASAILTTICAVAAVVTYGLVSSKSYGMGAVAPWAIGAMLVAMVGGFVLHRKPSLAPFLAPPFALAEGIFVGALSFIIPLMYNKVPEGLILQAVILTFGILFALLLAFGLGMIRLGSTAIKVISIATMGLFFYYLAGMVLHMVGVTAFPRLGWETGALGIGFSLFVVVLASLNLVLDFQFIEAGVQNKAPRYMEWYGAYGLLVTVVWLYIETLRLLAKLRE